LLRAVSRDDPGGGKAFDAESYQKQFIEAMDDDFNTAKALGVLFDLANAINQAGDAGVSIGKAQSNLTSLAREVLGLKFQTRFGVSHATSRTVITGEITTRVNRLIEERVKCREEKNWQRADEIRKKLSELGVILEDAPQKTKRIYKRAPSVESLDSLLKELGITL